MKIQSLLEAPLPDDWDSAMYNERVPFSRRVKYAQERAKKIGSGSSRVAFVIPYQGRDTVLKIAKNAKGIAQNSEESTLLNDWYLSKLNIVIPMIDYDEANSEPTWIHTEFANKIKNSDFKRICGVGLEELIAYCDSTSGRRTKSLSYRSYDFSKINEESDFVQSMVDFIGNYTHIPVEDLMRLANWGMYQGRPVIIDIGYTDDVVKLYYPK